MDVIEMIDLFPGSVADLAILSGVSRHVINNWKRELSKPDSDNEEIVMSVITKYTKYTKEGIKKAVEKKIQESADTQSTSQNQKIKDNLQNVRKLDSEVLSLSPDLKNSEYDMNRLIDILDRVTRTDQQHALNYAKLIDLMSEEDEVIVPGRKKRDYSKVKG